MQDLELLRRLLRAKDRMDAASHEEWPVSRLARVSGTSEAHFSRSFKEASFEPGALMKSTLGNSVRRECSVRHVTARRAD